MRQPPQATETTLQAVPVQPRQNLMQMLHLDVLDLVLSWGQTGCGQRKRKDQGHRRLQQEGSEHQRIKYSQENAKLSPCG